MTTTVRAAKVGLLLSDVFQTIKMNHENWGLTVIWWVKEIYGWLKTWKWRGKVCSWLWERKAVPLPCPSLLSFRKKKSIILIALFPLPPPLPPHTRIKKKNALALKPWTMKLKYTQCSSPQITSFRFPLPSAEMSYLCLPEYMRVSSGFLGVLLNCRLISCISQVEGAEMPMLGVSIPSPTSRAFQEPWPAARQGWERC